MSDRYPNGRYTIETSDVIGYPPGGEVVVEGSGDDYSLTVDGGDPMPMEPLGAVCLRSKAGERVQVVCPTGAGRIAGLVSELTEEPFTNGGGQWTAEGGGDVDPEET